MAKKATRKPTKKKPIVETKPPDAPKLVSDLAVDPANPRDISKESSLGLSVSLDEFGDISGITFNQTTGQLVCGHQRIKLIAARWGPLPIEATAEGGVIRSPDGHVFPVRYVEWSIAKQRAANVAANSQKLQGEFNENLDLYLEQIQAEYENESPGVFDDLMLNEIMAQTVGQQSEASSENEDPDDEPLSYQVVVECEDEEQQGALLDRFNGEGMRCSALVT